MPEDPRCPACGRPARASQASCAECDWPLNSPPRAGTVTAQLRRDFEARLARAREDQASRDERALRAALGQVVAAARPGSEATVITLGKDQIEASAVYLDRADTPLVRDAGNVAWKAVMPQLPDLESARHERLARSSTVTDADQVAALVRGELASARGEGLLVVTQPAGWRTLEAVADAIARAARPAARVVRVAGPGGVPVSRLLAEEAAAAPLRRPYYLLTASVEATTGEVRPRPRQLFDVGATQGTQRVLALRRMPGDMADTTLAIFAGDGLTDWSAATPLAMYQVQPPAGLECTVRTVLDGPGQVRVTEPAGAVPHPDTWKQVFRRIPARVVTATSPVDLVCAIDLAGDMDTVLLRKALVRQLVELLDGEYPAERLLRVAIVTCTDHVFGRKRGGESEQVIQGCGLGGGAEAISWLSRTEGVARSGRHCAPVEDLLSESLRLLAASPRLGRRPRLVTLAGRLPHPYPQPPTDEPACPLKIDWRKVVGELDGLSVRYTVVGDELPSRGGARASWDQLGPAGQYSLPAATARQLAESLGLLAGRNQRVPLPLTDDQEGASQ
jgi:hypothetical protein